MSIVGIYDITGDRLDVAEDGRGNVVLTLEPHVDMVILTPEVARYLAEVLLRCAETGKVTP